MKNTLARSIFCAAALLCIVAWNAQANLVTNGGFETGNFSGWTHTDPSGFDNVGSDPLFANSGTYHANLGASPNSGHLSQSLTTVAGNFYTLSFYLANDFTAGLGTSTAFEVFWNGVSVLTLPANAPSVCLHQLHNYGSCRHRRCDHAGVRRTIMIMTSGDWMTYR